MPWTGWFPGECNCRRPADGYRPSQPCAPPWRHSLPRLLQQGRNPVPLRRSCRQPCVLLRTGRAATLAVLAKSHRGQRHEGSKLGAQSKPAPRRGTLTLGRVVSQFCRHFITFSQLIEGAIAANDKALVVANHKKSSDMVLFGVIPTAFRAENQQQ